MKKSIQKFIGESSEVKEGRSTRYDWGDRKTCSLLTLKRGRDLDLHVRNLKNEGAFI